MNKAVRGRGLSKEEIGSLLNNLDCRSEFRSIRNKAIVFILVDCGMRVRELANLKLEDENLDDSVKIILGRGSRERYVPICLKTKETLWKYMLKRDEVVEMYGETDRLWVGRYDGKLDVTGVQQEVRKIGLRLYPVIAV